MSAPTRILRRAPAHGKPVRVSSAGAICGPASPWATSATTTERRQRPCRPRTTTEPSLARYLSTNTQPSPTSSLQSSPRQNLATFHESNTAPPPTATHSSAELWFSGNPRLSLPSGDNNQGRPPDDRKVKLGKTLRILQERLPTLLQTPLPQEVLSPRITLHLFPSTHPHLPTVTGRVAYRAALWSSPIAWNRVPLVGNVRLEILSERMVDRNVMLEQALRRARGGDGDGDGSAGEGGKVGGDGRDEEACGEQLVVRWRTVGGGKGWLSGLGVFGGGGGGEEGKGIAADGGEGKDGKSGEEEGAGKGDGEEGVQATGPDSTTFRAPVGDAQPVGASDKEFTGLFIFDFDREGRILTHTIEHVQEGGQWEKGVGAKVVGLTDWLLGGMRGGDAPCPAFARARLRKGG